MIYGCYAEVKVRVHDLVTFVQLELLSFKVILFVKSHEFVGCFGSAFSYGHTACGPVHPLEATRKRGRVIMGVFLVKEKSVFCNKDSILIT